MAGDAKIGGLGATSGTGDASTWLDIQSLGSLKAGANAHRADTTRQVAQQFESMFLGMMLKSMRDAKLADSPFDSDESRLYQDMYDKQVSLGLTKGKGLGIADMLVRQLTPEAAPARAPDGRAVAKPSVAASAALPRVDVARAAAPFDAGSIARHEGLRAARRTEVAAAAGTTDAASATATSTIDAPLVATAVPAPLAAGLDGLDPSLVGLPERAGGEYAVAALLPDARVSTATDSGIAGASGDSSGATTAAATVGGVASPAPRAQPSRRFADTPEDFVRKVLPHARAAAAELGVSPTAIVAQAALETGWGRNVPASPGGAGHNLFGIKAGADWGGARVGRATLEVAGGIPVRTQAAFRAYDTVADGFRDYVNLLSTSSRYGGVRGAGADPARFAHALQAGGYATDPHYAHKILAIVNGSTLREAMAAAGADRGQLLALKTDAIPPIS
jgi:flagellar protein FlgJ